MIPMYNNIVQAMGFPKFTKMSTAWIGNIGLVNISRNFSVFKSVFVSGIFAFKNLSLLSLILGVYHMFSLKIGFFGYDV